MPYADLVDTNVTQHTASFYNLVAHRLPLIPTTGNLFAIHYLAEYYEIRSIEDLDDKDLVIELSDFTLDEGHYDDTEE